MNLAKAGTLLSVEAGEYSDYRVIGFFVVLQDFCPDDELRDFLRTNPEQKKPYRFSEDAFLASLLAKGLLLEIAYGTMYMTNYSNHEEFAFRPGASS